MRKENGPAEIWIALLGREDVPADGITDYCAYLGRTLTTHGIELKPVRIEWIKKGWLRSLRDLWHQSKDWRGLWVIPQYTAMGWSNHGFPTGALVSVAILRWRGARCAVLFHEPWGTTGRRLIDRVRYVFQNWTVKTLHRVTEKSIFTIPLDIVSWLPKNDTKSTSIPLGPNIPENLANRSAIQNQNGATKTVVVFCVSDAPNGEREVTDIAGAARVAASGGVKLRVVFVGRGTTEAKSAIERAFFGAPIEVCIHGICEASEVTRIFSESDAMLAVRGPLYPRRGSALAGLACGLPIVGYDGESTGTLIEEAGIALVPFGDYQAMGSALQNILTNRLVWQEMHEKNLWVQQRYLSWNVIAAEFVRFLGVRKGPNESSAVL
jgi:glycosyltransferase involved in cell wall biosynthesis